MPTTPAAGELAYALGWTAAELARVLAAPRGDRWNPDRLRTSPPINDRRGPAIN